MAVLLAAMLMISAAALAEEDGEEGFGFIFGDEDDGYTGEWITLNELGMEFCLPEGWTAVDAGLGAAFRAVNADKTVGLTISEESAFVNDIVGWAEANLTAFETDEANFYDVIIEADGEALVVRYLDEENRLIAFRFDRASEDALSRDFALQIVGSVQEGWYDDVYAFGDEFEDLDYFFDAEG